MNLDTPLTIEGRARLRKAVAEYESWGYETRRDALRSELGAEGLSKGHVYTLPCIHEGRRHAESGQKETYVLKVCSECADGNTAHWEERESAYCFLDLELGVWETAVRRGDDDLLCPVLDAEQREGWMVMEYCDPATNENLYNDPEAREHRNRTDLCAARLRDHGWLPESYREMDVEAMALDGHLIALDYEAIYHSDWMYDPLDWHRSLDLRRDTPHTASSILAFDE